MTIIKHPSTRVLLPLATLATITALLAPATASAAVEHNFEKAITQFETEPGKIAELSEHPPGPSNREIGEAAGVSDQGQISKLLHRLQRAGLIENTGNEASKGMPNAWAPTEKGRRLTDSIRTTTTEETR